MVSLVIACTLAWAGVPVEATQLNGDRLEGELTALTADQAVIQSSAGEQRINYAELIAIKPLTKAPEGLGADSKIWVELVDGSDLLSSQYTVADSLGSVVLLNGGKATVSTRSIRSVRFAAQKGDLVDQWTSIINHEAKGDLVVVRKTSQVKELDANGDEKTVTRQALDYLEGLVHDITADKVTFEFNDQMINVNRSKLEGIVYYHPPGRELPDAMCQVDDENGSSLRAKSLETDADQIKLVTVAGARMELPLRSVRRFDFSSGKIAYLSDLDPDRVEWNAFFDPRPIAENLTLWNMPRRDINFDGGALQLANKSYPKGLAIHSRTMLAYRLSGKYGRFLAVAGIDDSVGDEGHVELVIRGDGAELYRGMIAGSDPAPVELDLDVTDVRRLTILVDFGEAGDIADHLDLCNARVKK